jgi:CheY-like chemotaxis protein
MLNTEIVIILIEDNMDDANLAIMSLRASKLTNKIIHLKNGDEALRYFFSGAIFDGEKCDQSPKVVFLDLKMPKVDGIQVLSKLKSDPDKKNIPVVILTSSGEDPDIKKCYELGANSYVVKPIEFDNFSKQITELGLYWTVLNAAMVK